MTTAEAIAADFRKGAMLVTVGLSAFVCLALFVRARLPLLSVRVVTALLIVCALFASPALVSITAGPLPKLGQFVGIRVDPSLAIQWGPAVIAAAVGFAYSIVVLKRSSWRVMVSLAGFLVLYGLTWRPGVPLVRSHLRDIAGEELRRFGRELRPDASAAELAQLDREAESLRVDVNRAIPMFPALVWVEYSAWIPRNVAGNHSRVVIWAGSHARFLSYFHPDQFGLPEERWVPQSINPILLVALLLIACIWVACDVAIWLRRRRQHSI